MIGAIFTILAYGVMQEHEISLDNKAEQNNVIVVGKTEEEETIQNHHHHL